MFPTTSAYRRLLFPACSPAVRPWHACTADAPAQLWPAPSTRPHHTHTSTLCPDVSTAGPVYVGGDRPCGCPLPSPPPDIIFPLPSPHHCPSDSRLPRRSTLVSTAPPHPRPTTPPPLAPLFTLHYSLSSRDLLEKDPSLATLRAIYYTAPPLKPLSPLPPIVCSCHCHIVTRLPILWRHLSSLSLVLSLCLPHKPVQ